MKISYSDDVQKGPGHGILTFSGALFPDGPYSLAVLRASDHAYLAGGSGGVWAGEIRFMPVQAEITPEGALTVPIGPEVVDALDPQENYRVTLKPERGEGLTERLDLRGGVTYSLDRRLDNTGMRAQQAPPRTAPEPAPVPEPEPVPERATEPAPATEPPRTEERLDAEALTLPGEAPARPRRVNPVLVVALVAALLAGALATWKFFDGKAQEEEAALSGRPAPAAPSTTPPAT
ncbi:MAG: hypothetical protein HDQ94_00525, partial [Desulfovibrio sp.]|nr:hypothetical protein [Desulfovibrio sp.]